jgi:hypothetical protein
VEAIAGIRTNDFRVGGNSSVFACRGATSNDG